MKYIDAILETDDFLNKILLWINGNKINLYKDEICIKQNQYRLSFVVKYFSKGQKKRVKVN